MVEPILLSRTEAFGYAPQPAGMRIEPLGCVTFGFAPPPAPEPAPEPCAQCGGSEAIRLYATARTEYYRCTGCGRVQTVTLADHDEPVAAA